MNKVIVLFLYSLLSRCLTTLHAVRLLLCLQSLRPMCSPSMRLTPKLCPSLSVTMRKVEVTSHLLSVPEMHPANDAKTTRRLAVQVFELFQFVCHGVRAEKWIMFPLDRFFISFSFPSHVACSTVSEHFFPSSSFAYRR